MQPLNVAFLIWTVFNYGLFCWGAFMYFAQRGGLAQKRYRMVDVSTVVTWFGGAYCLYRFPVDEPFVYAALLLQAASTTLFFTAKRAAARAQLSVIFSKDKPSTLLNLGPYKYVRHPFYTSYLTAYFGAAIGSTNFFPYVCAFVMLVIYYRAARFEEAKFGDSDLASAYEEYRSKTGAFLPKLIRN